jgi:hypothetical protein
MTTALLEAARQDWIQVDPVAVRGETPLDVASFTLPH